MYNRPYIKLLESMNEAKSPVWPISKFIATASGIVKQIETFQALLESLASSHLRHAEEIDEACQKLADLLKQEIKWRSNDLLHSKESEQAGKKE